MNWFTGFLFWAWGRLFLGRLDWEILERAIAIAKKENQISAELGMIPAPSTSSPMRESGKSLATRKG